MQLENILYYVVMAGLFFVMMRYGCGAHVMGHGHRHGEPGEGTGSSRVGPAAMEIDPVCGMSVATATAKTAAFLSRVYYFCSQNCREKFEAAPATLAKAVSGQGQTEHHHGC